MFASRKKHPGNTLMEQGPHQQQSDSLNDTSKLKSIFGTAPSLAMTDTKKRRESQGETFTPDDSTTTSEVKRKRIEDSVEEKSTISGVERQDEDFTLKEEGKQENEGQEMQPPGDNIIETTSTDMDKAAAPLLELPESLEKKIYAGADDSDDDIMGDFVDADPDDDNNELA